MSSRNGESLSGGIANDPRRKIRLMLPLGEPPGSPRPPPLVRFADRPLRGPASIDPPRLRVAHRIHCKRLDRLPLLAIAEVIGAERGVAARIRRAAEADLVPRPRMRVERLADVLRRHLERTLDVQLVPRAAAEVAL